MLALVHDDTLIRPAIFTIVPDGTVTIPTIVTIISGDIIIKPKNLYHFSIVFVCFLHFPR